MPNDNIHGKRSRRPFESVHATDTRVLEQPKSFSLRCRANKSRERELDFPQGDARLNVSFSAKRKANRARPNDARWDERLPKKIVRISAKETASIAQEDEEELGGSRGHFDGDPSRISRGSHLWHTLEDSVERINHRTTRLVDAEPHGPTVLPRTPHASCNYPLKNCYPLIRHVCMYACMLTNVQNWWINVKF